MKKSYRLAASMICLLLALTIGGLIHRQSNSEVAPMISRPTSVLSETVGRAALSNLCELSADAPAYRGKEIHVEAFHIGLLSAERLSVLGDCSDRYPVSAQITLAGKTRLPEGLLDQLAELMFRHKESMDGTAGRVIIDGRLDETAQLGGYDFNIVATDVKVEIYALSPRPSTHKALQLTAQ